MISRQGAAADIAETTAAIDWSSLYAGMTTDTSDG
jgi:hypothetical protein